MYTVCVRDHVMIAHSFTGEQFGPAQRLHGATYIVDVEFRASEITPAGIVIDIGRAASALRSVLAGIDYRNLDETPELSGKNTTTEFLAKFVFDRMARNALAGELGPTANHISSLKVTLHESHVAWAAYEGPLSTGTLP